MAVTLADECGGPPDDVSGAAQQPVTEMSEREGFVHALSYLRDLAQCQYVQGRTGVDGPNVRWSPDEAQVAEAIAAIEGLEAALARLHSRNQQLEEQAFGATDGLDVLVAIRDKGQHAYETLEEVLDDLEDLLRNLIAAASSTATRASLTPPKEPVGGSPGDGGKTP